jgi:hypothetical protein
MTVRVHCAAFPYDSEKIACDIRSTRIKYHDLSGSLADKCAVEGQIQRPWHCADCFLPHDRYSCGINEMLCLTVSPVCRHRSGIQGFWLGTNIFHLLGHKNIQPWLVVCVQAGFLLNLVIDSEVWCHMFLRDLDRLSKVYTASYPSTKPPSYTFCLHSDSEERFGNYFRSKYRDRQGNLTASEECGLKNVRFRCRSL